MAKQDRIGVVTVTYNSADVLPAFLRCVMDQTHQEFLLFAVDNASKDDTLKLLGACADERLRIIANPDNRGVAAGNNQGILAALEAGCSSVLLLNNDTEFDAGLFAQLDAELDRGRAEMVCPKMMYLDEPNRIWAAGGKFFPWAGYLSVCSGQGEIDRGQYDKARLVTDVPTCCVLIGKVVFEKIGLMDERYFVYVDDSDFMYRALKAGVKLMYQPEAKLLHKAGGLTGGEESPFTIHYSTKNRIFFQLKHLGLMRTIPWLVVREISWILAVLLGKQTIAWYKLKNRALRAGLQLGMESYSGR
jgi:GT2 family glycosyltransferase